MRYDSHPAGRHFLQIPGPTNVPDRVLRAIDHPTIDLNLKPDVLRKFLRENVIRIYGLKL